MAIGFAGKEIEGSGGWHHYMAGWVPVIAIVACVVDGAGKPGCDRAEQRAAVDRVFGHRARGLHVLAVMAHNGPGLSALVYYAATYGFTTVGAIRRGGGGGAGDGRRGTFRILRA